MAITVGGVTPLLEVFDLPASVAFYRDVLGFEMISGDDKWWCMLRLGEATIMLNTAYEDDERPPAPDARRARGHGDTSLYFSAPDPDAVYAHIKEKGWHVKAPEVTSYGMKVCSTRDPDGFQLLFICPA
jgi:glyoxylase I family protein